MRRLLAVVMMVMVGTLVFAQNQGGMGKGMGPRDGTGPMHERQDMMAKLNLSEDQQAQMHKMRLDLQKKQTALQAKVRIARLEMQELYAAANPDKAAIEKKMKEVSDLQYQEKLAMLDHQFSVKAMLNPEQQKIWKKHLQRTGHGMRERVMERRIERRIEEQD